MRHEHAGDVQQRRVLLLMSASTYRAGAFLDAARQLGIEPVAVVDMPEQLREYWHQRFGVEFADVSAATERVVELARELDASAVLAVDDSATELAALAAARLGFGHNDPASATAARDKLVMRQMLRAGGVPCPFFHAFPALTDPSEVTAGVPFPCVVKPLRLSGSRGVIRADNAAELVAAFRRLQAILESDGVNLAQAHILVEEYLPGDEVALEGLLTGGELHVLALFDKPDPLVGPFFEETIYVTPSRHSPDLQAAVHAMTERSARALGLREGPVHAELRINARGAWLIEMAGRSIGGLCSTILSFGAGMCLEELILRHATGMKIPSMERTAGAVGVMMIPIPKAGTFRRVDGVERATEVPGITSIEITAKPNYPILPLPEGASYLGFIFARAETPDGVELALRSAHDLLDIRIDPVISLTPQLRLTAAITT